MNSEGRVTSTIMDTTSYKRIFVADSAKTELKVLSLSNDSLPEQNRGYEYIDMNFDDLAIIPRGTWQEINKKNGKVMTSVVYDNNGNPIKVTRWDENGKVYSERSFPSYNTRQW
jgi:hypothetical protein